MKIFVSWSGKKSRDVAHALRDWLPSVLHVADPFVSSKDIRAGTRWQAEIAGELDDTEFGLICVTKENQASEWLNFEAGALAKSVDSSRLVPLAVDLAPADIANPLGQFQAMRLTKDDITATLVSINEVCEIPISDANLRKTIDKWWPDLEHQLNEIAGTDYGSEAAPEGPTRSERELLEEVLNSVRGLAREPSPPRPVMDERVAREVLRDALRAEGHTDMSMKREGNLLVVGVTKVPSERLLTLGEFLHGAYGIRVGFVKHDEISGPSGS